MYELEGYMKR
jgi:hypothetical protein